MNLGPCFFEGIISVEVQELALVFALGDGYLRRETTGNVSLRLGHCEAQKDYLRFKVNLLKSKGLRCGRWETYLKQSFINHQVRFICHPVFREVWLLLQDGGVKLITPDLIRTLSNQALVYWILDDGTINRDNRERFGANDTARVYASKKILVDPERIALDLTKRFGRVKVSGSTPGCYCLSFSTQATQELGKFLNPIAEQCLPKKVIRPLRSKRRLACRK